MTTTDHGPPPATDVSQWERDGYLLPEGQLLPVDAFDTVSRIFDEHLAARGTAAFNELDMPHASDERLLGVALNDAVLDRVAAITGPDIALWSTGFICKLPKIGAPTPWHADSEYWRGRLDDYRNIVTVWLAIDDVDRGNGCMRVIPGSHTVAAEYVVVDDGGFFPREAVAVDDAHAVHLERAAGECSLHDGRILHGATANTSPRRRAGYTMRYLPAGTHVVPEANVGHRVWLARGRGGEDNVYANA